MANKILQIDLQNDITPQIGSYDNTGSITPNNWQNEGGVYSLGPTNTDGTTPYYWFTPTKEVTDFDLCWEDYQDHEQTTPQYHLEIGDSAGNVVLSVSRANQNYHIGPVGVGNLAYQTWHKMLVEVRKASASSSTVTIYVDGKKIGTGTSDTLLTSAKIALLGHVPDSYYWQNAGQRLRYVTIYDRSYSSKGVNLDGIMTTITGFIHKLKGALSTVAFSGSYNDLSDKPTISTVNNGTLTIQQNGTNVQTFTANQSTNATANIQCVDLSTAQTIGGQKTFTASPRVTRTFPNIALNISDCDVTELPTEAKFATLYFKDKNNIPLSYLVSQQRIDGTKRMCLRTHRTDDINNYYSVDFDSNGDFYPEQNNAINLGTSALQWNNAYIKSLTINGVACGDILTHNVSEFVNVTSAQTIGGIKTFSSNVIIQGSKKVTCNLDNSFIELDGGTTWGKGGSIVLSGQDRSSYTNSVLIVSKSDSNTDILQYQNGELKPLSNNTNNSSLGTSTNKWSKVYSDDVVHTTGDETIGGEKTFSNLRTYFGRDISCYSFRKYGKNLNPTSNSYQYLNFSGNLASEGSTNDWSSGYLEQVVDTNGGSRGRWFVQDTSENNTALEVWVSSNDKQVRPLRNGDTDLGTINRKWKSFNGINPGALSLPGGTVSMNLIGDVSVVGTEKKLSKDITVTGYIYVDVSFTSSNRLNLYNDTKKYGIWIPCDSGRIRQIMPISVGDRLEFNVLDAGSTINAIQLFACQGNV